MSWRNILGETDGRLSNCDVQTSIDPINCLWIKLAIRDVQRGTRKASQGTLWKRGQTMLHILDYNIQFSIRNESAIHRGCLSNATWPPIVLTTRILRQPYMIELQMNNRTAVIAH